MADPEENCAMEMDFSPARKKRQAERKFSSSKPAPG